MAGATMILLLFSLLHLHKVHAVELDIISSAQFLTDGDTLVSPAGVFELGFFRRGSFENRYLGVWYKKVPVTPVWVANRDHPHTGASPLSLKISDSGTLVLSNNISTIWSSNATITSRNATAKLRDTGNLVLLDENDKILWQSFDYPTDTLLPGMKLGRNILRGMEWHLSSWKDDQDPAPGGLTWGADTLGYPESKLKQGTQIKFRGGPWTNQRLTGVSVFSSNLSVAFVIVINQSELSFSYTLSNSSIASRIALNSSGHLESWVWAEGAKEWQLTLSLPADICDAYNICSSYASCSANTFQQSCACLDKTRFVPRNEKSWGRADWSDGCVRRTPLDCNKGSEVFLKYSNLKLPDTESTWYYTNMSLEECEAKCSKNCTCIAYANPDRSLENSGCVLWFDDLKDIRAYPEGSGGQDIYVRMDSSELAVQLASNNKGGGKTIIILAVIIPGAILIGVISTWLWYARRKRILARGGSLHVSEGHEEDIQLPLISFSAIVTATAGFSEENILGEGGFGAVYKGVLEEGGEVAVKRLSKLSSQGVDEFKNEVIFISKLQHRNLVKLLGFCIHGDEKLLIYEYLPNKSLDSFLFDKTQSMLLDWTKRFHIIKGISKGLLYLHHDSRLRVIHRDLKASNILLDMNMNPKISDFGIARTFGGNETEANTRRVVGTYGYMAPEYALDGLFSIKSDVFSYGVLVLEIVSGQKNRGFIHPIHGNNLIGHAWSLYKNDRSMDLIDETLAESCYPPEVIRSIEVALLCVQQNAGDRPDMASVVIMLGGERTLPQPKQPAFFMETEFFVADYSSSTNPTGSINSLTITEVDSR